MCKITVSGECMGWKMTCCKCCAPHSSITDRNCSCALFPIFQNTKEQFLLFILQYLHREVSNVSMAQVALTILFHLFLWRMFRKIQYLDPLMATLNIPPQFHVPIRRSVFVLYGRSDHFISLYNSYFFKFLSR